MTSYHSTQLPQREIDGKSAARVAADLAFIKRISYIEVLISIVLVVMLFGDRLKFRETCPVIPSDLITSLLLSPATVLATIGSRLECVVRAVFTVRSKSAQWTMGIELTPRIALYRTRSTACTTRVLW